MSRVPTDIRRGRLTPDEGDQIVALAEKGLGAGQIALRLNRHPATVSYAMHRFGVRKLTFRDFEYVRNGIRVKSFSRDEDAFLTALRVQGFGTREIAELVTKRFGHPRTLHCISVRLVLLSNLDEAA